MADQAGAGAEGAVISEERGRGPELGPGHLAGLQVRPDPSLERHDGGRVVVGGSPLTLVRLTSAGAELLGRLLEGEPVPRGQGATAVARRLLDAGLVHPAPALGRHTAADVTVVVPVLGSAPVALLDALGAPGPDGSTVAAVVVVDDASPEPVRLLPGPGAPRRLVRRDRNGGPAAARMTGLAEVRTPLVAFVDADCRPPAGWLDPLLAHLADPAVAAAAPRIVAAEPAGGADPGLARYEAARSALDLGPAPARVRARTRVSYVPSAALLARVDALAAVGGFDPALRVGEDVDLVWRLDEAGWVVRYEPTSEVAHHHRTDARAWLRRRYDYGTSAGPLAQRHPGALVPVDASVWSVAAWGLAASGHPALGAGVAGATAALLARRLPGLPRRGLLAARVAGRGHLAAGEVLATAAVRPWWPVALLAAATCRPVRRPLAAAALVPPLLEWARRRPPLDPVRWTALRLADDVAYSAGVWTSALAERTTGPLLPDLTSWPRPSTYTRWRRDPSAR